MILVFKTCRIKSRNEKLEPIFNQTESCESIATQYSFNKFNENVGTIHNAILAPLVHSSPAFKNSQPPPSIENVQNLNDARVYLPNMVVHENGHMLPRFPSVIGIINDDGKMILETPNSPNAHNAPDKTSSVNTDTIHDSNSLNSGLELKIPHLDLQTM